MIKTNLRPRNKLLVIAGTFYPELLPYVISAFPIVITSIFIYKKFIVKKILVAFLILLVTVSMISPPGSRKVLKKMYDRYAGKWYKTFSFNQTTEVYRNDSLKHTETWYESIKFPKDFRIDFGDPDSGKAVIYKNDSSYFLEMENLQALGLITTTCYFY